MAETVNPAANPPAEPAPAQAAAAPKRSGPDPILRKLGLLLGSTFFLVAGIILIFLAVLLRKNVLAVPGIVKPALDALFPHFTYLVGGLGLLFLGRTRSMAAAEYTAEKKKNKQHPHAWKIPLILFQAVILHLAFFLYALPVSLGWVKPVTNPMGLAFLVFFFFIYVIWYLFEHARHRLPSLAAVRMAILTLILAGISCVLWTALQMVFPSLLVALLALIALVISLFTRIKGVEQVGFWPKSVFLILSALLLAHVAWYALPFSNPWADLVSLQAASQGIQGEIASLAYFQSGNKPEGTQLAAVEKDGKGWTLHVLNPDNDLLPAFSVPAGSQEFHAIFAHDGAFLLTDMDLGGGRAVWKVDSSNGKTTRLKASGIEPFGPGRPWSERNGQLLYVTHGEGKYLLRSLTLASGKSTLLLGSEKPILSPSWVNVSDPKRTPFWAKYDEKVAYTDGQGGLFYVLDLRTKTHEPLKSDLERMQGEKFDPQGKVLQVLPSPDNSRYAYVTQDGPKTVLWVVGANGDRRDALYETRSRIKDLAWHPDSQQLVFEEKHEGLWQDMDMGFLRGYSNVKVLDANQGGVVSLIPPPISHFSPAVSPDGVKVAFAAGDGLWYPSERLGLWIATLR